MLPKRHRLRRSADIRQVRRNGRRWHHPLLFLFTVANTEKCSRFAISVNKRVGNAVVRNRCKRRVREAIRSHLGEIRPGWDGLFVARNSLADASFSEISDAVSRLLLQADLLERQ